MITTEFISLFSLLVTLLGVILLFRQIKASAEAQRAIFLKDLLMKCRENDIAEIFYKIEYGEFNYGSAFHGSEDEPKLDRLLSFADIVCELRFQKLLTSREIEFFDYQFQRIAGNKGVKEYFNFLNSFYQRNGVPHKPFAAFQKYIEVSKVNTLKRYS